VCVLGWSRCDAHRRTVVRSLLVCTRTLGRVALPAGYSVRAGSLPALFQAPAEGCVLVRNVCMCVCVRACVHKYHCRASPRQQVWFATRRCNLPLPHKSHTPHFITSLPWPGRHYRPHQHREGKRWNCAGCKFKTATSIVPCIVQSGSFLSTFRSSLLPQPYCLKTPCSPYIIAIDISEYPTVSAYCLTILCNKVACYRRFGVAYCLNTLSYNSMQSGSSLLTFCSILSPVCLHFTLNKGAVIPFEPVPVAVRLKAWVCGRSSAGIVGSISAEGMDICLLCLLCVV
jgi:hypothetical protein